MVLKILILIKEGRKKHPLMNLGEKDKYKETKREEIMKLKVTMNFKKEQINVKKFKVHFPSTPVKYLADLRSRANSQQYSSIYEDRRPKIEDIERSDDRKTRRTNLTGLKPAEDFFFFFPPFPLNSFFLSVLLFFLFLLPSILYLFYSFFRPSLSYSVVVIFVKKFLLI